RVFVGTFLSSVSTAYPKPAIGGFGFEISAIVMFIGSVFVLYYAIQMIGAGRLGVWLVAGAGVALASILFAFVATDRDLWVPPTNGVVKIGVIVPTAGPYAMLGNSFVKAVQMAKDDLKGKKYRYELVIRDSGPDPLK